VTGSPPLASSPAQPPSSTLTTSIDDNSRVQKTKIRN
jgi:hypothetical protein